MVLTFSASVPAELKHRDLVGVMVRELCRHAERERNREGIEWRVMSAFNEAFNNIVEHAYAIETPRGGGEAKSEAKGEVEVSLRVEQDRVVLRMIDRGEGFDFNASGSINAPPHFDGLSEGGMGLYIIRQSMSEVTYERTNDRNLLTMTSRFSDCTPRNDEQHGDTVC